MIVVWIFQNTNSGLGGFAATISVAGAIASWSIGRQGVAATVNATVQEHRPNIEFVGIQNPEQNSARLNFKNSGRSQAFGIHVKYDVETGSYPPQLNSSPVFVKSEDNDESDPSMDIRPPTTQSGGEFSISLVIFPALEYRRAYHFQHFSEDQSYRFRVNVTYNDAAGNEFSLPLCFESFQPARSRTLPLNECLQPREQSHNQTIKLMFSA